LLLGTTHSIVPRCCAIGGAKSDRGGNFRCLTRLLGTHFGKDWIGRVPEHDATDTTSRPLDVVECTLQLRDRRLPRSHAVHHIRDRKYAGKAAQNLLRRAHEYDSIVAPGKPARVALQKLGLNPVKDITLVQIGTIPERLSALDTGKVQAAMLNAPDNFRAQKRGLYKLMGVRLPYQGIGVGTTRAFIRENPDVARRYIRSQVEAVHRLKTDREAGMRVLAKYLALQDKEILQKAYDDGVNDEILPAKQYPTLEGIKKILEPLGETDPKAKAAKPEDFVDMRFIRELDESGFTNDLYKGDKK